MDFQKMFNEPVGKLRLQKVFTLSESEPVFAAVRQMVLYRISCALVMKNKDTVSGIFSESDYVRRILAEEKDAGSVSLKSVMTPDPIMIKASTTIGEALKIMKQNNIHHIPILNPDGNILGVLGVLQIMELIAAYFPHVINSPWHVIKKDDPVW